MKSRLFNQPQRLPDASVAYNEPNDYGSSCQSWHQQIEAQAVLQDRGCRFFRPPATRFRRFEVFACSYYGGQASWPKPVKPLSASEEATLFRRYRRGRRPEVLEEIVNQYLFWPLKMANRYKGPRLELDDAISAANLGFRQAIESFKPGKTRFCCYSFMVIRRHLIEALLSTYPVKVTRHTKEKIRDREKAALQGMESGEPATVEELFERLSNSPDVDVSLLHERQEDAPFMPSESPSPAVETAELAISAELKDAIATLDDLERQAIERRHYVEPPQSFEEIGRGLGVSKDRVRAAYQSALGKLKEYLS